MPTAKAEHVFCEGDTLTHPTLGILVVLNVRDSGSVLVSTCAGIPWLLSRDAAIGLLRRESPDA